MISYRAHHGDCQPLLGQKSVRSLLDVGSSNSR